jgi:hypothetical protein
MISPKTVVDGMAEEFKAGRDSMTPEIEKAQKEIIEKLRSFYHSHELDDGCPYEMNGDFCQLMECKCSRCHFEHAVESLKIPNTSPVIHNGQPE